MLELIPQPDGRVAIHLNGTFRRYARDMAHAEELRAEIEAALVAAAPAAWAFGRALWDAIPASERARINHWVADTQALAQAMRKRERLSPLAELHPLEQYAEMKRAEREYLAQDHQQRAA